MKSVDAYTYHTLLGKVHISYRPSKSSVSLFVFDEPMDDPTRDSGETELGT